MEKKSRGFPNLDKYLNERGRKLVNYKEGAEIFVVAFVIVGGGNLPSKPKKPCAYSGCPALVTGRYCEEYVTNLYRGGYEVIFLSGKMPHFRAKYHNKIDVLPEMFCNSFSNLGYNILLTLVRLTDIL